MLRSVRTHPIVLLSCLLVAVGVCAVSSAAPVPNHLIPKTLPFSHPTAVDSEWVYTTPRGEIIWVITKCEVSGDTRRITIECTGPAAKQVSQRKMLLDHTGWFLVMVDGEKRDPPLCLLKLPHVEGQTWDTEYSSDGVRVSGQMRAATVIQVTPPGPTTAEIRSRFTVRQQGEEATSNVTHRYAHRVGMVEMNDGSETWTLKSFTPGKE